ncbi:MULTISPECIES: hypothetical protein [Bacillus subtilis group]|uniref:Uncharacterized protein n=1 Tax=Bacillus subtilis TaxID=1423 RepID=A0AAQ3EX49_BACIU|nr:MULTISPECIES: hypothetical protein [Bacillus subtilis group]USY31711.1 hypothetical protein NIZ95_13185 [Bacillus velezensis]WHM22401.1 hypothetical protein QL281_04810 [Bacillus subtilis]
MDKSREIVVDVSDKLANILNGDGSIISTIAPYAVAVASVIASIVVGWYSYRASKSAEETSHEIGEQNIKALDKSRYIEIISKERSEWIHNVRNNFAEFNEKFHLLTTEMNDSIDYSVISSHLHKQWNDLRLVWAKIDLYLNPTEVVSKKLKREVASIFLEIAPTEERYKNFDQIKVISIFMNVTYLQNIILKSEWRRLKKEVEKGHELEIKEVEEIYKEIANKHSESMYQDLLKKDMEEDASD